MVDSKSRNKRQYLWQKDNTERINLLFEKGTKEKIDSVRGSESVSEYVRIAVANRLAEDLKTLKEKKNEDTK